MTVEGIVLRSVRGTYTVQAGSRVLHCALRGNLKKQLEYSTSEAVSRRVTRVRRHPGRDALAVGDRVTVAVGPHGAGVIESVLPRRSTYSRAGFRGREHTVVCNLDQVVIVFAAAEPNLDPWKLDRFLVAAEAENLAPVIVANKCDLASPQAFGEYDALGYAVVATSAITGHGMERLGALLTDKISAFVGPSGAGKSSLLNRLQPGLDLRTSEVGRVTHKGRHTTTAAQLLPLRTGGWVADTPGLRQFDLLDLSSEEIADCFPEFRALLGKCRFDDCRHRTEPGCAIKEAAEAGVVGRRRYESFLSLTT